MLLIFLVFCVVFFGVVRVANLFSFLCCVFGGVRVAHLFSFLCCVFGGVRVAHLFSFLCCIFCLSLSCGDRPGRDCMVAGFTTTCAIGAYHH